MFDQIAPRFARLLLPEADRLLVPSDAADLSKSEQQHCAQRQRVASSNHADVTRVDICALAILFLHGDAPGVDPGRDKVCALRSRAIPLFTRGVIGILRTPDPVSCAVEHTDFIRLNDLGPFNAWEPRIVQVVRKATFSTSCRSEGIGRT